MKPGTAQPTPRSFRVLARLKRRETVDALKPNAAGTASAQRAYSRVESPPSTLCNSPVSSARGCCSRA
jgi:hypothetical protein